jgi:hypothetical protein
MEVSTIVEIIRKKPYFLKDGPKRTAKVLNVEELLVREAFSVLKQERKQGTKTGVVKLENHLSTLGLSLSDVKQIKFWENFNGEQRYSIDTKKEWYKQSDEDLIAKFKQEIQKFYHGELLTIESQDNNSETCAVLSLQDLHLDKITLISETGTYSDVDSNIKKALGGFKQLLKSTMSYKPAKIIFIVGSDAFNANDSRNTTVKGTPQDVHYGWHEQFIKIYNFYRHCVDLILMEGAECHIAVVEGNHDADKCFYLGQLLEVTYETNRSVTIDNSRTKRKYFEWGATLLGFAHGDTEKKYINTLPMTMFIENKDRMHRIRYSEMLLGDIHHGEKYQTLTTKDFKGCTIRFLRAVSEVGRWEMAEGYVGIPKSMDSFVYSKFDGLKANLQIHL